MPRVVADSMVLWRRRGREGLRGCVLTVEEKSRDSEQTSRSLVFTPMAEWFCDCFVSEESKVQTTLRNCKNLCVLSLLHNPLPLLIDL